MLIFLYGPDTYRSRQKLNGIIEQYKKIHQSGLNLKFFEGKELNFEDFEDELQQISMFREKKLAVLADVFSNSEFKGKFFKKGKDFVDSEDIILFYETSQMPEKDYNPPTASSRSSLRSERAPTSLFDFLIKNAKSQEFELLEGEKLKSWVKEEFENHQVEVEPKAQEQLINYVGNNLWQMANEIKKLVSYKKGEKIQKEDVELLIRPKIETDIFKTIDAIAIKNKRQAFSLIHKHLEKGDNPLYLLSMINFQFRNLLIIKDLIEKHRPYYSILKTSGLHPFVVKKSYHQANKFTFPELKKIYQRIFQVDLDIKTGKIEPEVALDLFIAEI